MQLQPVLIRKEELTISCLSPLGDWDGPGLEADCQALEQAVCYPACLWWQVRQGIWGNTKVVPRASKYTQLKILQVFIGFSLVLLRKDFRKTLLLLLQ